MWTYLWACDPQGVWLLQNLQEVSQGYPTSGISPKEEIVRIVVLPLGGKETENKMVCIVKPLYNDKTTSAALVSTSQREYRLKQFPNLLASDCLQWAATQYSAAKLY